jgi:hypothetical protein
MRNRIILFIVLFAAATAVAAMLAGRDSVNAVLQDAGHWLNYFVHVHYDY